MPPREVTCCFTGHRPGKLPWRYNESDPDCASLKARIADAVEAVFQSGVRHFICGMALGCDMYFAEAVAALRAEHPDITLEAAVPYSGQSDGWSRADAGRYDRLIAECDLRTVVSPRYTSDCMQRRNEYMVDASSVIIAVYDGCSGGTLNTLRYALAQGLEIIQIGI